MDTPLLNAFVATEKYPGVERFETAIRTLEEGLAAQHIWNVDYVSAKDTLSRVSENVEKSLYGNIRNLYYPCGGSEVYRTWADNDPRHRMGLVNFLNVPGFVKKMKTVKNAPELKTYIATLSEVAKLAELCNAVKPFIEKGRKPSENPVEKDVTNTGICPVCMRRQKLAFNGTMVAHGYTIKEGYGGRNGMCIGFGYKAWELAPDGAIAFRDGLVVLLGEMKDNLAKLEGNKYRVLKETVRVRKEFGRYEDEERVYERGTNEYEHRKHILIVDTENHIHHVTRDIEDLNVRIAGWKAQPLMYGGAETQERWKSKLLQKGGAA
jgi:hypothetical protein